MAGEQLHHDLKRMEIAYLNKNKREYELTKHISLALLDPIALVKLKETGECYGLKLAPFGRIWGYG